MRTRDRKASKISDLFIVGLLGVACLHPFSAHAQQSTQIDGEFEGCDYDKVYPLRNGRLLICDEYHYTYSYSPQVIVLDRTRVVIKERVYRATVEDGRIVETRVVGDFEGCDFDSTIAFDNALLFVCATYHYHFAYRPEAQIVFRQHRNQVFIDGVEYRGTLYKP